VFVSIAGVANLVPYKRYRELRDLFSSAATYVAPVRVWSFGVPSALEASWFRLLISRPLGVRPTFGRVFDTREEKPGSARTVVVSQRLWGGARG
jgi:hypothetical protein